MVVRRHRGPSTGGGLHDRVGGAANWVVTGRVKVGDSRADTDGSVSYAGNGTAPLGRQGTDPFGVWQRRARPAMQVLCA